jgi:hypothetical protein
VTRLLAFWRTYSAGPPPHSAAAARAAGPAAGSAAAPAGTAPAGHLPALSVRDLLAWVGFVNTTAPRLGALPAYVHGAYLTVLDGE